MTTTKPQSTTEPLCKHCGERIFQTKDDESWFHLRFSGTESRCLLLAEPTDNKAVVSLRQRAEAAALRIYNEIDGAPDVPEMIPIIIEEFSNIGISPASAAPVVDKWSKESPQVNGVYWWRADAQETEPDIHRVVDGIFFEVGEQFSRVVEGFGGEWLGPITPTLSTVNASGKEVCPHCAGSGFESDSSTPCGFCGGDGWVFQRDVEAYEQGHASGHREATDFCLRLSVPSTSTEPAVVDELWEALKAEVCKSDKAELIVFLTEEKLRRAWSRLTPAAATAAPVEQNEDQC